MNMKLVRWGVIILFCCTVMSYFAILNFGALLPALAGLFMIVRGGFDDFIRANKKESRRTELFEMAGKVLLLMYIVLQFACIVMISNASQKPRAYQHKRGYDAVVVLGAGFWGDEISLVMEGRLAMAAKKLMDYPDAVAVLTGAQVHREGTSEAEMMRDWLVEKYGIDPKRLLLENRAATTLENFEFSKSLLDARFGDEPRSVLVITSGFHLYRSERIARRLGFAADWKAAKTSPLVLLSYTIRETGTIIFGGYLF